MEGLIGRKVGMTQIFDDYGMVVPLTVLEIKPVKVVQVKTVETDGYASVQVGMEEIEKKDKKKVSKTLFGHCKKAKLKPMRVLKEFRVADPAQYKPGQEIKLTDVFKAGELVKIRAASKGRGFAGVFKRHHFGGQPASMGTHESFRGPGSIGNRNIPGRIFPGKRMAGHMGATPVSMLNIEIVKIMEDKNLLLVRGGVPGPNGGIVTVLKGKHSRARKALAKIAGGKK